jgi:3-oxoacyl-(acyl-carrier-protein) synthase
VSKTRVAVTGIGIVSPLGNDTQSSWQALLAGRSGVARISQFDASAFPTQIAAELKDFSLSPQALPLRLSRYLPNFAHCAAQAAFSALSDAEIFPDASSASRWGMVLGSGMMTSELAYWQEFQSHFAPQGEVDYQAMAQQHTSFYQPREFAKAQANGALAVLSQHYGIRGYSTAVHTACASGGQALGLAWHAIQRGDCDYVLAGGFDSMINPFGLASFCLLGAVCSDNETPTTASRPFDLTRNGFVLGEGAAFLILENWQKAEARGAKIYAEFCGEGNSLSSYRITDSHPDGDGAIQCIRAAMRVADIDPLHVDYINAHGTSTKMNDLSEAQAIRAVFGDRVKDIAVSSTKSLTGHLIAAAGALEAAFTVLTLQQGMCPINANLTQRDPDCDLAFVTEPLAKPCRVALSNSFGFGGSNSCLAFSHAEYRGAGA